MEKIIWSFCEKFYGQNFSPISLFLVLFTAGRDVCVMEIFKILGGGRAPPQAPVTLRLWAYI